MADAASPPLPYLGALNEPTTAGRDVLTFHNDSIRLGPTLRDDNGDLVSTSVRARLHGMFVMSGEEIDASAETESVLTCYRRNLFEVSGVVSFSTWPHSISGASCQSSPITGLYATLSAVESRDWTRVAIVSNVSRDFSEPTASSDGEPPRDYELLPTTVDRPGSQDQMKVNFSWDRLQFRSATANNGRKRKSIRQQFRVDVNIYARTSEGSNIRVSTASSSLITVRGRSPKNFLARNDHPLSNNVVPQALRRSMMASQSTVPEAMTLSEGPQTQLPVLSLRESTAEESLVVAQTLTSPTMWDWIDLSMTSTQDEAWDLAHFTTAPNTSNGDDIATKSDYFKTRDENSLGWAITPTLYDPELQKELSMSITQGASPLLHNSQHQSATLSNDMPGIKRAAAVAALDRLRPELQQQTFNSTQHGTTRAERSTFNHLDETDGGSTLLWRNSRYRYIPVGLENWQPPVDPVFWPHPWCHAIEQKPTTPTGPYR